MIELDGSGEDDFEKQSSKKVALSFLAIYLVTNSFFEPRIVRGSG